MGKATKQQFITTVEGIPGTWRTLSGGGFTADTTTDFSGGSLKPDILSGPPTNEDLELVRTYDPEIDDVWIRRLRPNVGRSRHTVTKQPTDINLTKIGKPTTFPDCLLKGLVEPDTDSESGDRAEVTITLANTGPA